MIDWPNDNLLVLKSFINIINFGGHHPFEVHWPCDVLTELDFSTKVEFGYLSKKWRIYSLKVSYSQNKFSKNATAVYSAKKPINERRYFQKYRYSKISLHELFSLMLSRIVVAYFFFASWSLLYAPKSLKVYFLIK